MLIEITIEKLRDGAYLLDSSKGKLRVYGDLRYAKRAYLDKVLKRAYTPRYQMIGR